MIISDRRKQAFCHIPKNGGSSLRAYFSTMWQDSRQYQGRQEVLALENEMRDLTHITPLEAAHFFNDDLIGRGYTITAVIRPPLPRFSSALLQYIRTFGAEDKNFVTAKTVENVIARTSVYELCETSASLYRHVFFRPQIDFLKNVSEEKRNLIPMDNLSKRFPDLPVENKGGRLPSWLGPVRHPVIKSLTTRLGPNTKSRLSRALIRKDPEVNDAITDVIIRHRAFIDDFYAQDREVYEEVSKMAT